MKEYCSLCNSTTDHSLFLENGKDWEYHVPGTYTQTECRVCGLVRMSPMPSMETVISFYPKTYHGYESPSSPLTSWLIQRNLRIRQTSYKKLIGADGAILDVGAGSGEHFSIWGEGTNWKLYGLDVNDYAAQKGRNEGRDIQTATMETYHAREGMFDLIIMNHLLEHVDDPRGTVEAAYRMLRPGGYIVGEVPNLRSLDFMLFKRYWGGCHWPRHLHQFHPATLRKTVAVNGFSDIRITYLLHTGHWALSVQNVLEARSAQSHTSNGRTWYYPFLLVIFIPVNLLQKLVGFTGIIGFTAQKK